MKRRHRNKKRRVKAIRLWGHAEANKAVPYLRSVVGSLREHWLAVQTHERQIEILEGTPGPHKRDQLLAEHVASEQRDRAEACFEEALAELSKIDVFLLDPVQGLALIPFRREDELAWFVFDHFDEQGIVGWRLQQDPLEKWRSLKLLPSDSVPN
jgi:Uncharacterized conserved protein (DUF2203)